MELEFTNIMSLTYITIKYILKHLNYTNHSIWRSWNEWKITIDINFLSLFNIINYFRFYAKLKIFNLDLILNPDKLSINTLLRKYKYKILIFIKLLFKLTFLLMFDIISLIITILIHFIFLSVWILVAPLIKTKI